MAILGVLVFHAFPGRLEGGFTGVDVFFVLSGYLIASVILHEIRDGAFSLREFYVRRAQRLLPNAAVTVAGTVALSYFALLPSEAAKVARHGLFTLFNLSNVYIWRNVGGYWGDTATSVPLLHTWSLAVEEQFYLVFPLVTLLLGLRWPRLVFPSTAGLVLASLALSLYGTPTHPIATFYLLPTRAWEPLLGAALAAFRVPASSNRPLRTFRVSLSMEVAGWAGLATVVMGFLVVREELPFPGLICLVPTLGSLAVLISVADGETGAARLLSRPAPVLIGKLSYSLYLWHWPLIVLGRRFAVLTGRSAEAGGLLGAFLGIGLSIVAFRVVEQPLRRRGRGRSGRLLILAGGFAASLTTCIGLARGQAAADPQGVFDRPAFNGVLYDVAGDGRSEGLHSATRYSDVVVPPEEPRAKGIWRTGGIVHDWSARGAGATPRVVVLGSSHALMYGRQIDEVCKGLGVSVAFLSADGAPAIDPIARDSPFGTRELADQFVGARRRWISEWKPDVILVVDRWDGVVRAAGPITFRNALASLVRELEPHTKRVIVFSQVPTLRLGQEENLREFVTWQLRLTGSLPRISPDSNEANRRAAVASIEAIARTHPKLRLLRADEPFYLQDGSVRYSSGRSFYYADDDHLSESGAELLREQCRRAIAAGLAGE